MAVDERRLSTLTQVLREGSFAEGVDFVESLVLEETHSGTPFVFGRRRQRLLHVAAEVASLEFVEYLVDRQRQTEGMFLVTDNRIINRPLGRSLCSFARTALFAQSLHSA